MVDLALVLVGVWLLFTLLHTELRRREIELARAKLRARTDAVRQRARALEVELEGLAGPAQASDPILVGYPAGHPENLAWSPFASSTAASLAEGVPPRPEQRLSGTPSEPEEEPPANAERAIERIPTADRAHEPA